MELNAIVGNPPYSLKDGGAQRSALPIYPRFVSIADRLASHFVSLVIPCRWFTGGKGKESDDLRNAMLDDQHMACFHDFLDPDQLFPGTNIRGGVCYFLRNKDRDYSGSTRFVTHLKNGALHTANRRMRLGTESIFIRSTLAKSIIDKVSHGLVQSNMSMHVSSRKPFGLDTTFKRSSAYHAEPNGLNNPVICYSQGFKQGFIERSSIASHIEWIGRWKVFTPRANNIGTELNDDNLNAFVASPNTVCTESYLAVGGDLNLSEQSTNNLAIYMRTRFVRYLHSLAKTSHDCPPATFAYIPMQDFTPQSDIDWTHSVSDIDRQLYKKYGFTDDETAFIESMIKPMKLQ